MNDALMAPAGFDVSCVAHVHSTYSDGTATVPELLTAARAAGAGAVLLTDHDTLGARRDGWEGMHDGVFLLVGTEVSPKHGHYLAFGVADEIPHAGARQARSRRQYAPPVASASPRTRSRRAAHAELDVDRPGVYRIGGRLWLLSNPVHLR